jgi:hypothetical protein
VAFSDGLPSKARGGATPGGFSSTPYLVGSTRAASNRRGSGELFGAVAVDGAKVFTREPGRSFYRAKSPSTSKTSSGIHYSTELKIDPKFLMNSD